MNRHINRAIVITFAVMTGLGSVAAVAATTQRTANPYGVGPGGELHLNKMPSQAELIGACTHEVNYKHLSGGARESFLRTCEKNR